LIRLKNDTIIELKEDISDKNVSGINLDDDKESKSGTEAIAERWWYKW
jgi:hypothetical protein